jgi:hypothetical protein
VSNVTDYAVSSVNVITFYLWTYDTNGNESFYIGTSWGSNDSPTNKYQLDQLIIAPRLSYLLEKVCTNTSPNIDKSRGVFVYVGCDIGNHENGLSQYDLLYTYNNIQLVKNQDGSYSTPDLSGYSTQLGDQIPFYVPNLQWARVEVGYKGDSYPFEVDDQFYDPSSDPIGSDGYLYLDTSYITNSSSTGDFWMKITLFDSNTFQIFDGDGNPVPETPMVLALNQSGTNATVTVNGGDSGRGFVLQSSAALSAWTNCSPVTFISPTNDLPGAVSSQFVYPSTNRSLFFRTATTNLPPS